MSAEFPGGWSPNKPEDTETDDSDEVEEKPSRGISLGKVSVGNRDGMGAESRTRGRGNLEAERSVGVFAIGGRSERVVEATVVDLSKKRAELRPQTTEQEPQTAPGDLAGEKHESSNNLAQTVRPAETLPTDQVPETGEKAPEAEDALVVWLRKEQREELEKRPFEGWLYGGEVVTKPAADLSEAQPIPTPVQEAVLDNAGELVPTPVAAAAEDEASTPSAPTPLRLVHSAGDTAPRPPRQRRGRAHLSLVPTASTPNITPPDPNVWPGTGANLNVVPPTPGVPFGGGPGGPGGPPFGSGINPNNGGGWNPAQAWRQTAPNSAPNVASQPGVVREVETVYRGGGAALALFGYLLGRRHGRKKTERRLNPLIRTTNKRLEQTKTDLSVLQSEQRKQRAETAKEQTRVSGELASFARRVGSAEQQNETLAAQNARLEAEANATKRSDEERAREAEKAERTVKAQAVQRFKSARARLRRFKDGAEQPAEMTAGDIERLAAEKGTRVVRDGGGWTSYEVDNQGNVVGEAESLIQHREAYQQEVAVGRGITDKGQPTGKLALSATETTINGHRPEATAGSSYGTSMPYLSGTVPGRTSHPGLPNAQQPMPYGSKTAYGSPIKPKQSTSPVWPYLLALAVIFICLVVLLH